MTALTVQDKLVQDRYFRFADEIAERREVAAEQKRQADKRHEAVVFRMTMVTRTIALGAGLYLYLQSVPFLTENLLHVVHFFKAVL